MTLKLSDDKSEAENVHTITIEFEYIETIETKPLNYLRYLVKDIIYRGSAAVSFPYKGVKITTGAIKKHINGKVDVVMSDMAVDTTGIKNIDSIQTGELCKEAMFFAKDLMKENGYFISKIFMGGTFNEIVAEGKKYFKEVKVFKPKSSRKDSKESFIICRKIR